MDNTAHVSHHSTRLTSPAPAAVLAKVNAACDIACQAIAPTWPLDRAIAVNPYWGRIQRPLREVAARMAVLGNITVLPSRWSMLQAWHAGRISAADLDYALATLPAAQAQGLSAADCIAALNAPLNLPRLPLLIDILDDDPKGHTRLSWRQAITHQVSQTCAAYFDEHQADWQPHRDQGLYGFWRETLTHDHGIGTLMGLPMLGKSLSTLPTAREEAECWVMQRLGLPESVWSDYLEAVLLTVNGWASWCAFLGWEKALAGQSDPHLRDLLAIRLAWGVILLECKDDAVTRKAFAALQGHWRDAETLLREAESTLLVDEVWQLALEAGYQRSLAARLGAVPVQPLTAPDIEVQAAFCIDVRSEPLRRALEAVWPAVQTVGFAGFFGLPIAYTPLATQARRPQLPGLLAPALETTDCLAPVSSPQGDSERALRKVVQVRRRNFAWSDQWQAASRWPSAAFLFVEAAGIGYMGKLAQWVSPGTGARQRPDLKGLPSRYQNVCRPSLSDIEPAAKVALAARVLHAMGLDRHLAPLVLLVGHGAQSANNAHAAGLDCGACCGQTGEVNARALARLLNEPEVRAGLREQGIVMPQETVFVAALHNTTTDQVEGFDLDLLSAAAEARWLQMQQVFAHAGDQVRRERAARLGMDPQETHGQLLSQFRRRANDGAQTRPEWGLAGNAALIIAPRQRSRGAMLEGRCFLHDYDHRQDTDGSVLELLMTAPMLVANWINWQYHASTCDPVHMGSGNKVLHNVVGGHIGVFEGNGGDLRIGLPRQSLHDGKRWIHEPLRLTVIIDAPHAEIDRVIDRHPVVRHLLHHGWLHLWRFEDEGFMRYTGQAWVPVSLQVESH